MAIAVRAGENFVYGNPQALFATGLQITPVKITMNQYAVSENGQRFLFNRRVPESPAAAITAVIPW